MRHATRHLPEEIGESHARGDGFIFGAILCAAVMVAILALHGGPDLLGGRFDTGIAFETQTP
jgi:hypothetical protein